MAGSTRSISVRRSIAVRRQASLVVRQALRPTIKHADFPAICNANTTRGKQARKPAFGASPPIDLLPFLPSQYHLGGNRRLIRKRVFAGLAGFRDREDQGNVGGIDGLFPRQADGPKEATITQCLSKRAA